ncbi:hypothetical protein PG988_009888 [Apiospora saccharicola]
MANHSSSKTSSGKKSKPKYNAADAWIEEQYAAGPWDGVDTVNASQWVSPGYGSSQHSASHAATQGSKPPQEEGSQVERK